MTTLDVSALELKSWFDEGKNFLLLDVREDWEREICALPNDVHLSFPQIFSIKPDFNPEQPIVVYCHLGVRSRYVVQWLQEKGFTKVYNLKGGIHNWSLVIDPSCKTY